MTDDEPVVLVIDDDESVAEVFALWIADDYDVRVANGGEEALSKMDEDVDVVLLDRRMPDRSGDEVLAEMRAKGFDAPVVMVTAVDPDLDILELPFEDYLKKPVSREEFVETIERLLALGDYEDRAQEHYSIARKLATVEAERSAASLAESEEYLTMRDRLDDLREEMDDLAAGMDDRISRLLFKGLDEESNS